MNKPLTKELRDELPELLTLPPEGFPTSYWNAVTALLSAEAYWREVVKNFSQTGAPNNSSVCCQFCGTYEFHLSDCPWLLAQEPV